MLCNGPLWCVNGQPLFGLSGKRYWELREGTRAYRVALRGTEEAIENSVDPEEIVYHREVWHRIWHLIEDAADEVKEEHLEDVTRW